MRPALDSPNTAGPAGKPKRYRLVTSRVEAHGARIKRFRLMQMEALSRLEPAPREPRTAR
jgi:hypothetical protein